MQIWRLISLVLTLVLGIAIGNNIDFTGGSGEFPLDMHIKNMDPELPMIVVRNPNGIRNLNGVWIREGAICRVHLGEAFRVRAADKDLVAVRYLTYRNLSMASADECPNATDTVLRRSQVERLIKLSPPAWHDAEQLVATASK